MPRGKYLQGSQPKIAEKIRAARQAGERQTLKVNWEYQSGVLVKNTLEDTTQSNTEQGKSIQLACAQLDNLLKALVSPDYARLVAEGVQAYFKIDANNQWTAFIAQNDSPPPWSFKENCPMASCTAEQITMDLFHQLVVNDQLWSNPFYPALLPALQAATTPKEIMAAVQQCKDNRPSIIASALRTSQQGVLDEVFFENTAIAPNGTPIGAEGKNIQAAYCQVRGILEDIAQLPNSGFSLTLNILILDDTRNPQWQIRLDSMQNDWSYTNKWPVSKHDASSIAYMLVQQAIDNDLFPYIDPELSEQLKQATSLKEISSLIQNATASTITPTPTPPLTSLPKVTATLGTLWATAAQIGGSNSSLCAAPAPTVNHPNDHTGLITGLTIGALAVAGGAGYLGWRCLKRSAEPQRAMINELAEEGEETPVRAPAAAEETSWGARVRQSVRNTGCTIS